MITWEAIDAELDVQLKAFYDLANARSKGRASGATPDAKLDFFATHDRLDAAQAAGEEQVDGACLQFASNSSWPVLDEKTEDGILLRIAAAGHAIAFFTGKKRHYERAPVMPPQNRDAAIRILLIDYWYFAGRIRWQTFQGFQEEEEGMP